MELENIMSSSPIDQCSSESLGMVSSPLSDSIHTEFLHNSDVTLELNQNNNPENGVLFDNLLFEIYDKWSYKYRHDSSWDSDTLTSTSEAVAINSKIGGRRSRVPSSGPENDQANSPEQLYWKDLSESMLQSRNIADLTKIRDQLKHSVSMYNSILVRHLKRRDRAFIRLQKNCDVLTAILQASSLKRREDTKLKFVMEPKPGIEAFQQWCDAMRGVARLPLGLPSEIRKKVWLSLANHHISVQKYDWNRVIKFAFNEKSNPDDDALGLQIVKDLHRTGCDTFTLESERAILKRVLLAYARWNKRVGYCQGFNVLAAIILEVMERNEEDSLKVMVYLVDHILPESYFAQNLQALSIDMAVFRELLSIHAPRLANHLNHLQSKSQQQNCYGNSEHYEPPLTNVFTMQWFLTLFATCLPPDLVLRIWDSIMLEGSEIILRTGIVIWQLLSDRLLKVSDADSFYCTMRDLTYELADGDLVKPEDLVHQVYSLGPMPLPNLSQLRERFTYNINPFSSSMPSAVVSYGAGSETGEDDEDEDVKPKSVRKTKLGCFSGIVPNVHTSSATQHKKINESHNSLPHSLSSIDISQVGPGAVYLDEASDDSIRRNNSISPHKDGSGNKKDGNNQSDKDRKGSMQSHGRVGGATQERMSTDLPALETQYKRIRARQKHTTLRIGNFIPSTAPSAPSRSSVSSSRRSSTTEHTTQHFTTSIVVGSTYPPPQTCMVNHLFLTHGQTRSTSESCDSHKMSKTKPHYHHHHHHRNTSINTPQQSSTINEEIEISSLHFNDDGNHGIRRCRNRSYSESDVCPDETNTSATTNTDMRMTSSLSDITSVFSNGKVTLLQLCTVAQKKQIDETNWKIQQCMNDSSQPTEQQLMQQQKSVDTNSTASSIVVDKRGANTVIPTPDLNSVLERHHKRIQNNNYQTKHQSLNQKQPDLITLENYNNDHNVKAARWVAEHHLPMPSVSSVSGGVGVVPNLNDTQNNNNSNHHRYSITTTTTTVNTPSHYNALFGSRTGLFNTLAHSRLKKNKQNGGILKSAYDPGLLQKRNNGTTQVK